MLRDPGNHRSRIGLPPALRAGGGLRREVFQNYVARELAQPPTLSVRSARGGVHWIRHHNR